MTDQSLDFLAAFILVAWSVWRIALVVKSLRRRSGPISVGQARALLWPGLILAGVLGWVLEGAVF